MKRKVKLYLGDSYNRSAKTGSTKGSIFLVISTARSHKVCTDDEITVEESTKFLEEAEKIQHLSPDN